MSGDQSTEQENRTEEASPQRREDARKKGQIPRSRDLVSTMTFISGVATLYAYGDEVSAALFRVAHDTLGNLDQHGGLIPIMLPGAKGVLSALAPVFVATTLAAVAGAFLQTGVPHSEWITPDLSRLNPWPRLKQLFQPSAGGWEFGKTMLKLAGVGYASYQLLYPAWQRVGTEMLHPRLLSWRMVSLAQTLMLRLGLLMLFLAVLDYLMARLRVERQLRMSKHEVREEMRHSEGNPQVKRRLRKKARELLRRRLVIDVPRADVVVVNPTHYAVALSYKPPQMRAPLVVAKGVDSLALRIRELARSAGVPVVDSPRLARDLHRRVKVGKEVPSDLYRAVAEVLAFVYRIKNRGPGGQRTPLAQEGVA